MQSSAADNLLKILRLIRQDDCTVFQQKLSSAETPGNADTIHPRISGRIDIHVRISYVDCILSSDLQQTEYLVDRIRRRL